MLSVDPEAVVFDDVPRGCTSEPAEVVLSNAAATPVEDVFTQEVVSALDLLWVVDNSGSMADALEQVGVGTEVFIEDFLTLPVDFHLGVIPGAGAEIRVSYTADAPCQ